MTAVALPARSPYLPLALRLLKSAAALGVVCWAVGVWLSYTGAHSFALAAGYGDTRAWLFPVTLDAVALVAYVALLMLPAGSRSYPVFVLVATAGAGAAAQGYHQAALGGDLAGWAKFAAGAWPMVAALVAGHLVWMIVKRAVPAGLVSALRELAGEPSVYVDTVAERPDTARDTALVAEPDEELEEPGPAVSRPPRLAVSAARVHVPPTRAVTADVDTVDMGMEEPVPARVVGQAVPVSGDLLDRVRAGDLSKKAAARMAGCSVKTIGRRLGEAAA